MPIYCDSQNKKDKKDKKKQLWQRFLLLTSSVFDTYATLITVVDQTVLESMMDTLALVISVTQPFVGQF